MGWLKDTISDFLAGLKDIVWNMTVGRYIDLLKACKDGDALRIAYLALPDHVRATPEIIAVYKGEEKAFADPGEFGVFSGLADGLYDGFIGLKDKIEATMGETLADALKPGSPELRHILEDAMDGLLDGVLKTLDPKGDKLPEELTTKMKDSLSPMLGLGLTFTVGTALAELIHPTKELGLGRISHFLYDTVGFKALMNAYIEPLRTNLIKQPTTYAINELTTPYLPRWADAVEWFGRGHIDEDEMLTLMKSHGVQTDYLWLYARMGTKPSSYFMLNAIGKEGLYDEEDFKFWLSDAGYGAFQITDETMSTYEHKYGLKPPSTTQIDFLGEAYKRMAERMQWMGMAPMSKKAFQEGLMSEEEFRTHMARQRRFPEVDDLEVRLVKERMTEEINKEYRRAYEKKYLYGRITKDELEAKLVEYGLQPENAKARIEYLFARKEGKIGAELDDKILTRGQIINAYKYGQKSKEWAVKGIDDLGYTTEDAILLTESVDTKVKNDTNKEWMRAFEAQAKKGYITIEELTKIYIGLGKDPDWSEARSAYISVLVKIEESTP